MNDIDIISAIIFCGIKIKSSDNEDSLSEEEMKIREQSLSVYIFRILFLYGSIGLMVVKNLSQYGLVVKLINTLECLIAGYEQNTIVEDFDFHYQNVKTDIVEIKEKLESKHNGKKEFSKLDKIICKVFNYCIMIRYTQMITKNLIEIGKFKINSDLQAKIVMKLDLFPPNDDYFNPNFTILPFLYEETNKFINNFSQNLENYLDFYFKPLEISNLHYFLYKKIIMKEKIDMPDVIGFSYFFNRQEDVVAFLETIEVKQTIPSILCQILKKLEYYKKSNLGYCEETTKAISELFGDGIEIVKYSESVTISDFAINLCNSDQLTVALGVSTHSKLSAITNLLIKERSEDKMILMEFDDKATSKLEHYNQGLMIENQIKYSYNKVTSIAKNSFSYPHSSQFPNKLKLPPREYIGLDLSNFFSKKTSHKVTSSAYCNIVVPHPYLPLYFTCNNKAIVSVWPFSGRDHEAINNFFCERITKEMSSKNHFITKLVFNSIGDEFMVVCEGKVHLFDFRHETDYELPIYTFKDLPFNDCDYLSGRSVILTCKPKNISYVYDLLLPFENSKVLELPYGGNFVKSLKTKNQVIICNVGQDGNFVVFDTRRNAEVTRINAHLNKIDSIQLSNNQELFITKDKGSHVIRKFHQSVGLSRQAIACGEFPIEG